MVSDYLLYEIKSPSDKTYIGVTNNFNRRMAEHKSDFLNRPQKTALHNSFNKYGFDNHSKEILVTGMSKEYAYNLEFKVIQRLELQKSSKGLNSRSGGLGGNMVNWSSETGKAIKEKSRKKQKQKYYKEWSVLEKKILEMKDTHTIEQISLAIKKSKSATCLYLKRRGIKIPRKPKYNLEAIAKDVSKYYESGMSNLEVMRITGYSKGTLGRAKKIFLTNNQGRR